MPHCWDLSRRQPMHRPQGISIGVVLSTDLIGLKVRRRFPVAGLNSGDRYALMGKSQPIC